MSFWCVPALARIQAVNNRNSYSQKLGFPRWMQGQCDPNRCVPDRRFLDVAPHVRFVPWTDHPWPMCPWRASGEANSLQQGKLGDVWPASPTPLTRLYRLLPLCQVQTRLTHYTPSYRFAPLGDTPVSLCSKYLGMGWFGQGHNIQGTLCQRGATSKNPAGDEITLHPQGCPAAGHPGKPKLRSPDTSARPL